MHYKRHGEPRDIIRRMRLLRGYRSDRALAAAAGVDQPTLSRYLKGTTESMKVEHFQAVANALGLTVSELLGEVPISSRAPVREAQAVIRGLNDDQVRQVLKIAEALFESAPPGATPPADPASR